MKILLSITKKPTLRKPVMICAWPGMGEVAFKLAIYLRDKLKMEEFANLQAPELFPPGGIRIENNLIQMPKRGHGKFYFYKNKPGHSDLIVFISDAQPVSERINEYVQKILALGREFKVKRIFTFAAMPQAIDHTANPELWVAVTNKKIMDELNSLHLNLKPLSAGQISGLNGLILGIAKEAGLEGICLLGEIPVFTIEIENPKSSLAILNKLVRILNIEVDLTELMEQARYMEQEIGKLIDFIQSPQQQVGPIGEEEIEKIKTTLSLFTKLPQSARKKIERLFLEAKTNLAKANDLKKELDHWNAYKEYEDRFLDLFKKPKNIGENKNN